MEKYILALMPERPVRERSSSTRKVRSVLLHNKSSLKYFPRVAGWNMIRMKYGLLRLL